MRKHIITATGCGLVALILATPIVAHAGYAAASAQYPGIMCREGAGGPSLTINNGDIQNTTTTGAYLYCPLPYTSGFGGVDSVTGATDLCADLDYVYVSVWCTKYEGSYVWGCDSYEGGVTCGGESYCTTDGYGAQNISIPGAVFSMTAYDYNTVEVLSGGSPGSGNYSDMYGYTVIYQN
jgi:hypothetical protein